MEVDLKRQDVDEPNYREKSMSTIHHLITERQLMDRRSRQVQPSKHHLLRDLAKPLPKHDSPSSPVADRLRMIAENAYYRAECRDFSPGYELMDWLAAEVEVDARLADRMLALDAGIRVEDAL